MKITTIRLRKLVSTPHGYGHHAVELEATVGEDENYEETIEALRREIEKVLRQSGEIEKLNTSLDNLRQEVKWHEDRLSWVRKEIETERAIIKSHGKLRDLADGHGIAWNDKGDALPFTEAKS